MDLCPLVVVVVLLASDSCPFPPTGASAPALLQVTPSSKVVGDLAQFMVQNELRDEQALVDAVEVKAVP